MCQIPTIAEFKEMLNKGELGLIAFKDRKTGKYGLRIERSNIQYFAPRWKTRKWAERMCKLYGYKLCVTDQFIED